VKVRRRVPASETRDGRPEAPMLSGVDQQAAERTLRAAEGADLPATAVKAVAAA
jgi:hypothetical protein